MLKYQINALNIPKLGADQLGWLDQLFTIEEIKVVAFQIGPLKTPGIDGKPGIFYHKFWHIVGELTAAASLHFLNSGFPLKELNKTSVAMIPKVDCPKTVSQFWPISFCNVAYKIISEVIVNRLRAVLSDIVSPFQNAFFKGRLVSDNIILGGELINTIKRRKKGK